MSKVFLIRQELVRSVDMSDIFVAKDSKDMSEETFKSIYESAKAKYLKKNKDAKYVVFEQCKATHFGYVNVNYSMYPHELGEQSAQSWTNPFEKPVLTHHDLKTDPIGRHVSAQYVAFTLSESQKKNITIPKGVILTHSIITDWDAMNKVLDKRYLTVSVSGNTKSVICSICGQDWLNLKDGEEPCHHEPGNVYKGKLCYKITGALNYTERSFVNNPADQSKSHAAVLTNYEMMLPEEYAKDEAYIAKNMLYSKESPVIRDAAGYSLFLAKESDGNYPKSNPFYAFTLGNRTNIIDCAVGDDDVIDDINSDDNSQDSTGQSDANLSTQSDASSDSRNTPHNNKEQKLMDWNTISVQAALDNVVGLKAYIEKQITDGISASTADIKASNEKAVADSASLKQQLEDSQKLIEDLTQKSISATTDSIITLMAELKEPQYVKIIEDAAGDSKKIEDGVAAFKTRIAGRGLSSICDMHTDLRDKLLLVNAAKEKQNQSDSALNAPAGSSIKDKVDTTGNTQDTRTDTKDQSTQVVRRGLPIKI